MANDDTDNHTDNDRETIINLDDARIRKRVGLPVNFPLERKPFSEAYSRHWSALMEAHTKFEKTMLRYLLGEPRSVSKWWSARRRFVALEREVDRCVEFWIVELGGNRPLDVAPVFKSEQDALEYALLNFFISQRICPYLGFWQDAINEAEAGNVVTFKLSDIPPWTDDD